MADQGQWFKLWIGADDDPDLGNLSLEDFGRWCRLGLYLKKHGTNGTIAIKCPALPLQQRFRVSSFQDVVSLLHKFPNCDAVRSDENNVAGETILTVTWRNWTKYQGDLSTSRVRKYREMKRLRGEEKRGDKKRRENSPKGSHLDNIANQIWNAWPKHKRKNKGDVEKSIKRINPTPELLAAVLAKIGTLKKTAGWKKDSGQYIPYPATWLNAKGWEDEVDDFLGATSQKKLQDL